MLKSLWNDSWAGGGGRDCKTGVKVLSELSNLEVRVNSELANMRLQGKGYFSPPRGKEKWARPPPPHPPAPKEEGPLPTGQGKLESLGFPLWQGGDIREGEGGAGN